MQFFTAQINVYALCYFEKWQLQWKTGSRTQILCGMITFLPFFEYFPRKKYIFWLVPVLFRNVFLCMSLNTHIKWWSLYKFWAFFLIKEFEHLNILFEFIIIRHINIFLKAWYYYYITSCFVYSVIFWLYMQHIKYLKIMPIVHIQDRYKWDKGYWTN